MEGGGLRVKNGECKIFLKVAIRLLVAKGCMHNCGTLVQPLPGEDTVHSQIYHIGRKGGGIIFNCAILLFW